MPTGRNIIKSSAYGLGFTVPLDPGPTSLEVSQHPDNRMYAWGLEGTGSAEGPSSASHATTAPQFCAQARPAPARPQKRGGGCASGEGAAGSATLQSLQERPRKAAIH